MNAEFISYLKVYLAYSSLNVKVNSDNFKEI